MTGGSVRPETCFEAGCCLARWADRERGDFGIRCRSWIDWRWLGRLEGWRREGKGIVLAVAVVGSGRGYSVAERRRVVDSRCDELTSPVACAQRNNTCHWGLRVGSRSEFTSSD